MSKYFFANQDKLARARKVVANNGTVKDRKGFPIEDIAEAVAYRQIVEENSKLSGEDLVAEVYKRLGGYLEVNGEAAEEKVKPTRRSKEDDNDDAKGEVIDIGEDGKISSSKKKKRRADQDE